MNKQYTVKKVHGFTNSENDYLGEHIDGIGVYHFVSGFAVMLGEKVVSVFSRKFAAEKEAQYLSKMNIYTALQAMYTGDDKPTPVFSFHATDDQDASSKAFKWERHHSLTCNSITFRPATDHEATHWLHNEWVR